MLRNGLDKALCASTGLVSGRKLSGSIAAFSPSSTIGTARSTVGGSDECPEPMPKEAWMGSHHRGCPA